MNNVNDQLKLRSEDGFPITGSKTSPLYSYRLRSRCSIVFLIVREKLTSMDDACNV